MMAKPLLLAICPIASVSGYGAHSRDLVKCLINMNKYDIKILPLRWGNTSLNALEPGKDDDIISRILLNPQLQKQPEIVFQVTVPNEFNPIGQYNIGVTAGIETTIAPASWIEGMNRMNINIVPSQFSKKIFIDSTYTKNEQHTNKPIGQLKLERDVDVIFEGCDTSIYKRIQENEISEKVKDKLSFIQEDWAFLMVGHWLQGIIGQDRKDIGMTIKVFLEAFKNRPNPPALIAKISSATFSVLDRDEMLKRIHEIKNSITDAKTLPNVYLLHGQLSDVEMNELYNHPKVKAMITLTKGEGFGRPLLEFSMCGKPIIASAWSGHMDFLDKDLTILLPGKIEKVHESTVNDFILKEAQWFTADYNVAAGAMLKVFSDYNKFASNAKKMSYYNKNTYSLEMMQKKLNWFFEKNVPEFPEEMELKLPPSVNKLKTINLPKLKKVGDK
jgi:glycosyltransferase involved in cell wall biosynthesis